MAGTPNDNLIPGERVYPCPFCSEPTIVRDRVYTTDGYPYQHVCSVPTRRVPNEKDFCLACRTLCWSSLCEDCQQRSVAEVAPDIARAAIAPPDPVSGPRKRGMGRAW